MKGNDLYFFFNPHIGLVKIGVSSNVEKRLATLQRAVGVSLDVLAVFEGAWRYERVLHAAFSGQRQHGEWFIPSSDLLAIAQRTESIDAVIARYAPQIAAAEARIAEEHERRRAAIKARRLARRAEMEEQRRREAEGRDRIAAIRAQGRRLVEESARARREKELARWQADRERILNAARGDAHA